MDASQVKYVEVSEESSPWPFLVPASKADDPQWVEGASALLAAAAGSYDASLEALGQNEVLAAIEHAERSVSLMPYCPHLLEYATALAIQHGDFEFASRLVQTAEKLGLEQLVTTYGHELSRRVEMWNEAIQDPTQLVTCYRSSDQVPSYRDLLLLKTLNGPDGGSVIRQQLQVYGLAAESEDSGEAQVKSISWNRVLVVVVAAFILGGVLSVMLIRPQIRSSDTDAVTERRPFESDEDGASGTNGDSVDPGVGGAASQPDPVASALVALSNGDVEHAATLLEQAGNMYQDADHQGDEEAFGALELLVADKLVDRAEAAWRSQDFQVIVETLAPLASLHNIGRTEGLYYLGIAAEAMGEDSLAFASLSRFMEGGTAQQAPHYRAQAAYSAAMLAQGEEGAQYARIVANEYPHTVYYNSRIRRLLGDGS